MKKTMTQEVMKALTWDDFRGQLVRDIKRLAEEDEDQFVIEAEHYHERFCQTHNIQGSDAKVFMMAVCEIVRATYGLRGEKNPRKADRLWHKIGVAHESMNRIADGHHLQVNGKELAELVAVMFVVAGLIPDHFNYIFDIAGLSSDGRSVRLHV